MLLPISEGLLVATDQRHHDWVNLKVNILVIINNCVWNLCWACSCLIRFNLKWGIAGDDSVVVCMSDLGQMSSQKMLTGFLVTKQHEYYDR